MAERRTIYYSGHVQGVGFRWSTVRALAGLPVTGYVRNLPDGRVVLVLEGTAAVTQDAASRVRDAMASAIQSQEGSVSQATGEFDGFGVCH